MLIDSNVKGLMRFSRACQLIALSQRHYLRLKTKPFSRFRAPGRKGWFVWVKEVDQYLDSLATEAQVYDAGMAHFMSVMSAARVSAEKRGCNEC